MPAQLLSLSEGPNILLDKPIMLFGRHPECDVQLNSRKVSRKHCCIAQVQNYLIVRDLGSTNGIRINGQRMLEGKIQAGDELTIGNFRYQVYWEGSEPPAKSAKGSVAPVLQKTLGEDDLEDADDPIALNDVPPGRVLPVAKQVTPMPRPRQQPDGSRSDSVRPQ